eukprot:5442662-Alexandrium_andersonii.AAC.1
MALLHDILGPLDAEQVEAILLRRGKADVLAPELSMLTPELVEDGFAKDDQKEVQDGRPV